MNNIKGYNIIAKDKKVSDLFLGILDINWKFAKIGYNAICTEALPLTFLERWSAELWTWMARSI